MRTGARSTVVQALTARLLRVHAVGALVGTIVSHSVVRPVEAEASNTRISLDTSSLLKTGGKVVGDLAEDTNLALDDLLNRAVAHVAGDVADEALASTLVPDILPQGAWGVEVLGADLAEEADGFANEAAMDLVEIDGTLAEGDGLNGAQVGRARALVEESHVAVTLEVGNAVGCACRVGGELLVVGADTVTVGIGVGEETRLQDGVGRGLNSRRHVGRVESDLLDLGKVVLHVLVQEELANLAERELLLRPDVSQVEDVDALLLPELLSLLGGHGLPADVPARVVLALNSVVEILLRVVGAVVRRVRLGHERSALLALHVHLAVDPIAVLVDKLQCVAGVTVHLAPAVGNTTVTHKDHDLVDRLGVLGKVVPEDSGVVGVGEVSLRVALLSVNEVRELGRVAQEEDGGVWTKVSAIERWVDLKVVGCGLTVCDHVPVALCGPELDTETTRVTSQIGGSALATDSREADGDGALAALLEDICQAEVIKSIGRPVESVCSTTLGVNDTLGDTLTIEMREQIDQVVVLEKKRTVLADTLALVRVRHRNAIRGRVKGVLGLGIPVVEIIAVDVARAIAIGAVVS